MNLIKVLWYRFEQCFGMFTVLLVIGFSQSFLDIYLTTFLDSLISKLQNLCESSFFSKYWKFTLDFKNTAKRREKVSCFWDNCFSIGIVKLSLLRTRYFSSAGNVLTSSPKIWHVKNRDFFQLNLLGSDQWIW